MTKEGYKEKYIQNIEQLLDNIEYMAHEDTKFNRTCEDLNEFKDKIRPFNDGKDLASQLYDYYGLCLTDLKRLDS